MGTDAEKLAKECGMVEQGHFLLTSGLHSPVYWEKFRVLENPTSTMALCAILVEHFRNSRVDVVVGPTTGGVILAFEVARQLSVRSIYAEKVGEVRTFRRGMKLIPDEKVLVVDDVLTTGKSVREVLDALVGSGVELVGIGVLVDRSAAPLNFEVPVFSCIRARPLTYHPDTCPLCRQGIPLMKPGSS
jgi:orotate phosphoribosyltransferase